ncbi:hypothetical protein RFI_06806, partial [Reticulomyxa filosa]
MSVKHNKSKLKSLLVVDNTCEYEVRTYTLSNCKNFKIFFCSKKESQFFVYYIKKKKFLAYNLSATQIISIQRNIPSLVPISKMSSNPPHLEDDGEKKEKSEEKESNTNAKPNQSTNTERRVKFLEELDKSDEQQSKSSTKDVRNDTSTKSAGIKHSRSSSEVTRISTENQSQPGKSLPVLTKSRTLSSLSPKMDNDGDDERGGWVGRTDFEPFAGDWVDTKGQWVKISPWGVIRYPNNPKLRFEAEFVQPNNLQVVLDKDPTKKKFIGTLSEDGNTLSWSNDTNWHRKCYHFSSLFFFILKKKKIIFIMLLLFYYIIVTIKKKKSKS